MAKVVIKTPEGRYLGGGREPEIVDHITRAYVYEDGPDVDAQLVIVNAMYGCEWHKADAREEYERWKRKGD
jgi:hypothetical protein